MDNRASFTINDPPLYSKVDNLKYIGPLIKDRFRKEGIVRLRDLRDIAIDNTKVQNTRLLRKVLTNPRSQECIGEPRFVKKPPHGMEPGWYTYCIRRVNRAAWFAIIEYLINKGVSRNKLPSKDPPRGKRELCSRRQKCASPNEIPRGYASKPVTPLEHITLVLLKSRKPLTAAEILSKSRFGGGREAKRKFIAILRGNTGMRGRELFKRVPSRYKAALYDLKTDVRRILNRFTKAKVLEIIRKL